MASIEELVDDSALISLQRIQEFDTSKLPRREQLGEKFSFDGAVAPANNLVHLFNRLPIDILPELPTQTLDKIKAQADQVYNLFSQILEFDPELPEATSRKEQIIQTIKDQYRDVFDSIAPIISYSVARTVDFTRLESEGRAAIQSISDLKDATIGELNTTKKQAQDTLADVRKAAAEQGVSQQAIFFSKEADKHKTLAEEWKTSTLRWASVTFVYGLATLFFHKIPWLSAGSIYDSLQIITAKIILFFVLSFVVILNSKNFMSHKHNEVINRHRQNALQTFNALADAAGSTDARDVVLNHAASSIFRPQESGYIKTNPEGSSSNGTIVELLPKSTVRLGAEQ